MKHFLILFLTFYSSFVTASILRRGTAERDTFVQSIGFFKHGFKGAPCTTSYVVDTAAGGTFVVLHVSEHFDPVTGVVEPCFYKYINVKGSNSPHGENDAAAQQAVASELFRLVERKYCKRLKTQNKAAGGKN